MKKTLRFEVFKRDSFTCQYCGNTPPSIILEIDHIHPKSKGGADDINNLIAACIDCNRGKRDILLNSIPNSLNKKFEILKEKELQLSEYNKFLRQISRRIDKHIDMIEAHFYGLTERGFTEQFKTISLRRFLKALTKDEIIDALNIAMAKFPQEQDIEKLVSYFCGICWNKIRGDKHVK